MKTTQFGLSSSTSVCCLLVCKDYLSTKTTWEAFIDKTGFDKTMNEDDETRKIHPICAVVKVFDLVYNNHLLTKATIYGSRQCLFLTVKKIIFIHGTTHYVYYLLVLLKYYTYLPY